MIQKNIFLILTHILLVFLGLLYATKAVAFDWPQAPENISAFFSQIRGNHFNSGIVFSESGEASLTEDGTAIMMIKTDVSDMGWFESPLGNALIVAHKNDIYSVYANLTDIQIDPNNRTLKAGEIIGTSGDSGWKDDNESLKFQIIDTKIKTIINPAILMDSLPTTKSYSIGGVTLTNRNNKQFVLRNETSLVAGSYTLYMNRLPDTMIHKSLVYLNGAILETVNYDTLKQSGSLLAVQGEKSYPFTTVYPDSDVIYLSEIKLSRGTNTIEIFVEDIAGTKRSRPYRVTAR